MAAPSNTTWGSIRGSSNRQGRIGISCSFSDSATTRTVTISIWLWTRYRCSDSSNSFAYGWGSSANIGIGSRNINASSNSSWSTSNQIHIGSFTKSFARGTSNYNGSASASYSGIEYAGGGGSVSVNFTIPAKSSYIISYNANGGYGSPPAQTKWHDGNIYISGIRPTKYGSAFLGWATYPGGGVAYQPGSLYSANASVTLYAVWKSDTYAIYFDANGGGGAPGTQYKTYGIGLAIPTLTPNRPNYNFLGWSTSPGGGVVYYPGSTYNDNADITLYAVWSLAYIKPRIYDFTVDRCDASGNLSEEGTYAKVVFSWTTDRDATSAKIEFKMHSSDSWSKPIPVYVNGKGCVNTTKIIGGALSTDYSYNIRVSVYDPVDMNDAVRSIGGMTYTIDLLKGGKGIAFGKPATTENLVDSAWGIKSIDDKSKTHISRNGVSSSWILGRENAIFRQHRLDGYSCMSSLKTNNGSWDIGAYDCPGFTDNMIFTHITDQNYNTNNNTFSSQIAFENDGTIRNSGALKPGNKIFLNNEGAGAGAAVYINDFYGNPKLSMALTGENNLELGYGLFQNDSGNTRLYGSDVQIYTKAGGGRGTRPYHRSGEVVNYTYDGAGYTTTSKTMVIFTIPVKCVIDSTGVSVSSLEGFIIRQNDKYCYGSSGSYKVRPDSYSASVVGGSAVRIVAKFSNTINVVNNSPLGIYWNGQLHFT